MICEKRLMGNRELASETLALLFTFQMKMLYIDDEPNELTLDIALSEENSTVEILRNILARNRVKEDYPIPEWEQLLRLQMASLPL